MWSFTEVAISKVPLSFNKLQGNIDSQQSWANWKGSCVSDNRSYAYLPTTHNVDVDSCKSRSIGTNYPLARNNKRP